MNSRCRLRSGFRLCFAGVLALALFTTACSGGTEVGAEVDAAVAATVEAIVATVEAVEATQPAPTVAPTTQPEPTSPPAATATPAPTATPRPTATPVPEPPGTRANPIGFGVDSGVTFTIDVFGDADGSEWLWFIERPLDITSDVLSENQFNDPPPEGVVFAAFDAQGSLIAANKEPLSQGYNFKFEIVGGATNAVYDSTTFGFGCGVVPDGEFNRYAEVFAGGTLTGFVCIPVPAEDLDHPDTQVAINVDGDRIHFGRDNNSVVEPAQMSDPVAAEDWKSIQQFGADWNDSLKAGAYANLEFLAAHGWANGGIVTPELLLCERVGQYRAVDLPGYSDFSAQDVLEDIEQNIDALSIVYSDLVPTPGWAWAGTVFNDHIYLVSVNSKLSTITKTGQQHFFVDEGFVWYFPTITEDCLAAG